MRIGRQIIILSNPVWILFQCGCSLSKDDALVFCATVVDVKDVVMLGFCVDASLITCFGTTAKMCISAMLSCRAPLTIQVLVIRV